MHTSTNHAPNTIGISGTLLANTPPRPPVSMSTASMNKTSVFGVAKEPAVYKPRMTYTGYYLCCGASVFANFSAISPISERNTDIEVKAALSRAKLAHHGLITAIITKTQLAANRFLHDVMVKNGFIPVARSGNPNHGNMTNLVLYVAVVGGGKAGILGTTDIEDCLSVVDAQDITQAGTRPL